MRFTPMTHMQSGEVCFQVEPDHNGITNGILSGSFLSGSEHWNYLEFRSPSRLTTQTYSLEVEVELLVVVVLDTVEAVEELVKLKYSTT